MTWRRRLLADHSSAAIDAGHVFCHRSSLRVVVLVLAFHL